VRTLRIAAERPITPTAAEVRALAVLDTLRRLQEDRLVARQRLAQAPIADDQAAAARDLEQTYATAAERVEATGAPGAETAERLAAMRETAGAYSYLADAIASGDQAAYDAARAQVMEAEALAWEGVRL
jgi:hypothetical protein